MLLSLRGAMHTSTNMHANLQPHVFPFFSNLHTLRLTSSVHQIPIRSESGLFITELTGSQDTINMIIQPSMGMGVCYLREVDRAVPSCFKVCQFKLSQDRSAAH